jgi:TolB-like protein/Tfp pilus assembly protein PilF
MPFRDWQPMSEVGKPEVRPQTQRQAQTETSAAPDASKRSRLVAKLTRLRGPIAAIAAVGAVLGGFVGYWNAYRTVRDSVAPAAVTSAVPAIDAASQSVSVAVLPFANLSPEKADEYFADGISEELLNVLAKIPGLRVSARTASFQFKGKDTSAREIGRQLGVGYVVEGSVRKAGSQVRITAQLVKVADGFQAWSETFNRDLKDIFAVQDEIALRVARVLQLRIRGGEKLVAGATRNPAAYEAYLRARETYRGDENSAMEAMRLMQQAVALDPDFALAHGELAEFYVGNANRGLAPRDKAFPMARAEAERALALDERTVAAHHALAEYAFHYAWDWDESDRHMRRALAIDPNYYPALAHQAAHELARGRLDSALDAARQAEERHPLSDRTGTQEVLIAMKRYDEAIQLARAELAEHPGLKDSLDTIGVALFQSGQRDEGLRILEERATANAGSPLNLAILGWAYGRAGQATKANAVLQRLADMGKRRRISPFLMAWVYAGLDNREQAFAELEQAYEQRNPLMPFIGAAWQFDSLRGDPRFRSLLKRMKLDTYFPEPPAPR